MSKPLKCSKEPKKQVFKIEKMVEFHLAYLENVQNVAVALAQCGHFVKVRREGSSYWLEIYCYEK